MKRSFFQRDTVTVAKELIGCEIVRFLPDEDIPLIVRINETEAYKGFEDPASHAFRGRTKRNTVMFGPPGLLYVYFTYGMHFCMNIVTEAEGVAGAVLLRGGEILSGHEIIYRNRRINQNRKIKKYDLLNGPAKLTQGLAIDLQYNGYDITSEEDIRGPLLQDLLIRQGSTAHSDPFIHVTGRIGISKGLEFPWRFVEMKK